MFLLLQTRDVFFPKGSEMIILPPVKPVKTQVQLIFNSLIYLKKLQAQISYSINIMLYVKDIWIIHQWLRILIGWSFPLFHHKAKDGHSSGILLRNGGPILVPDCFVSVCPLISLNTNLAVAYSPIQVSLFWIYDIVLSLCLATFHCSFLFFPPREKQKSRLISWWTWPKEIHFRLFL